MKRNSTNPWSLNEFVLFFTTSNMFYVNQISRQYIGENIKVYFPFSFLELDYLNVNIQLTDCM
jgi:hypothetical protein